MAIKVAEGYVATLPDLKGFRSTLFQGISAPLQEAGAKIKASLGDAVSGISLGGAAAAAGAALIVKGLSAATETTVKLANETRKLSSQMGISAEDASRLRVAGETLGVSTDQLTRGFGLFAKNLENSNPQLKKYGLSLFDAEGHQKSFLTVLGEAADEYKRLGGGLRGTAFAMNVFGRSGKDLIPILKQGSAGLQEMYQEAGQLGLVMSSETLQAARQLGIEQRRLGEAVQGLEVSVGTKLIPVLISATKAAEDFVAVLHDPISIQGGNSLLNLVTDLSKVTSFLNPVFGKASEAVSQLRDAILRKKQATEEALPVEDAQAKALNQVDYATLGAKDALKALADAQALTYPPTQSSVEAFGAEVFVLQAAASKAAAAAPKIQGLADVHAYLAEQTHQAWVNELQLAGGFLGIEGSALSASDAIKKLADARKAVNDLEKKGKKGTEEYAAAQAALKQAELDSVTAQLSLRQSVVDYLGSLKGGSTTQAQAIAEIRKMGEKAGLSKGEIDDLIGSVKGYVGELGRVPKSITTGVKIFGLAAASAEFRAWANSLQGTTIAVNARLYRTDQGVQAASGFEGWVSRPTWFHVAEAGEPEHVSVTPKSKAGKSAPGPGRGPVVGTLVVNHAQASAVDIAREIEWAELTKGAG